MFVSFRRKFKYQNGKTIARKANSVFKKSIRMIRSHEKVIEFNFQISNVVNEIRKGK